MSNLPSPFSSSTVEKGGISIVSSTNYYVATTGGNIFSTTDGGSTWILFDSYTYANFYSIAMLSEVKGLAGGSTGQGIFVVVSGKLIV